MMMVVVVVVLVMVEVRMEVIMMVAVVIMVVRMMIMKTDHTLPLSWVSFSNEISLILTNALSSDSQEMSGEGEEGRHKYLAFTLCHLL